MDVDTETGNLSLLTDAGETKEDVTLSKAPAEGNDPLLPVGHGPRSEDVSGGLTFSSDIDIAFLVT
jgi:hypothetical protein